MADVTSPFGVQQLPAGSSCYYRPTSTATCRPPHFRHPKVTPWVATLLGGPAKGPAEGVQSASVRHVAPEGVRDHGASARTLGDVALDPPEVGYRTEGLPGTRRDGSRGLEERGDSASFVSAARCRDSEASRVASDAADCELLSRTRNKTHNTGCRRGKSPTAEVAAGLALHSVGTAGFEPATP